MRYIIAYKLRRKNARRKVYVKIDCNNQFDAMTQFISYCRMRLKTDEKSKQWELLTGDWKRIGYYCEKCDRITDEKCEKCIHYSEFI